MKKLFIGSLLLAPILISADVIPAINSKGGALVMPEGKLKMTMTHINFDRNSMFEGTSEVQNRENLDATANITTVALSYGLSNKTTISAIIPYKNIEATARLGVNDVAIENKGLGDIVLAARHVLVPMSDARYQLSFDAGVKLPTGSTNGSFKTAPAIANDVNTPMPTQMGTGEFEYMLGLGATKMLDESWEVDAHAMYTHRPKAHNDYDFGDEIALNLSTTKAVTSKLNIGVEYNIKYNTKTDMGNDTNAPLRSMLPFKAFSGTAAYITPQIEFLPFGKPKLHIGVGLSFLAHYDLKEYQPLEKERFMVRLGYMF